MKYDVIIIGAGWAGLLACKYAKENNLSCLVLEAREDIGGVWNYSDSQDRITVMQTTITSSSATVTEACDFPMKAEYGSFLTHEEVLEYLRDYIAHFNLAKHIRFNQKVLKTQKNKNRWQIDTEANQYHAEHLVVCSGVNQYPREEIESFKNFTGNITHSGYIKAINPADYTEEDNILIYGGGETASDLVEQLVKTNAKITWSCPNGQHFFRKTPISLSKKLGSFEKYSRALDEASSPLIQLLSPLNKSKPGFAWQCRKASTGRRTDYLGHGVPEWHNDIPFLRAIINKNGHVVDFVHAKRVMPKGDVNHVEGNKVIFANGDEHTFSKVILCTGYYIKTPFLPKKLGADSLADLYKLIFNTDDPSLLFIGFARPTISSIPLMTEIQCRYAFKVLSGKLQLPNKEKIKTIAQQEHKERNQFFHHRRRPATLVSPVTYGYDLAALSGDKPNYLKLFIQSPKIFFKVFTAPFSAAHFLLNTQQMRMQAVEQLVSKFHIIICVILPIKIVFAKITGYGRLMDLLTYIRFKKDKNKAIEKLKNAK